MKRKESITTIRTIFKIHPLVYFFAIISILIGTYKDFIIISVLITIHELGHFLCAYFFKIRTEKIVIYPLGGISKFDMDFSENPKKEFLIICMGPIFQNIAYLLLLFVIEDRYLVDTYHIGILLFNLLPIYPLDGGKILNEIINQFFPFRKSFKVSIIISYLSTIILLFINTKLSMNMVITYLILMSMIRKEELKLGLYYQKLLLERILKEYKFKKNKIIKNINKFYRYRNNKFQEEKLYDEKEYLWKKYYNFKKNC